MDIFSGEQKPLGSEQAARPYRILVVDDSPMDLQFLLNGLSDNFVVSFASSAKEALSLANQFPQPDLMLLDVVMPEIDGYEMCAMLKNDVNTRNIPVIFVTGMQDTSDKTKGFNAGAVDYITKPIEIAELEARVQTHIRLKEQSQYLESMAYFDPLTQVPNRRKYNEVLQREWARCIRYHHQMSMIIIDIDFFKQYNEHYGHAEGDNCLIAVSRLLENQGGRPTDLFARIGGEEFVMLLPDCNAAGAMKKAEKMQSAVNHAQIHHAGVQDEQYVSVSMGVASTFPSHGQGALSLFQAADDALFAAKRDGRNCISIGKSDTTPGIHGEEARQHH